MVGPDFPRLLIVKIQHANPYYDDSYAVNSANLGPYGDAIETELIPYIEKHFRGIGQGWARFLYGGSTGGWESLAAQIFYPDHYNGTFAACPDPIDFHEYTNIDLYKDKNAFYLEGAHKQVAQPAMRDYLGHTFITTQQINQYELALGDHGRSGEQFDIWQAVYGPVGEDGYPQPIFDKSAGDIDHHVAEYWREHYDLEADKAHRLLEVAARSRCPRRAVPGSAARGRATMAVPWRVAAAMNSAAARCA